jgi:hypothetical protein
MSTLMETAVTIAKIPLTEYHKTMKIEFNGEGNFLRASVDEQELVPTPIVQGEPDTTNGFRYQGPKGPIILRRKSSYCVQITDLLGTRWVGYPAGTACP